MSVPGTEISSTGSVGERFIDNKRLDGTLVQMLNGAMLFVRNNMKTATIIDTNTGKRTDKTEYPVIAIRELVLNALIHRDYSIHTDSAPITIRMFSDRLEIENPGGLYGRMTLDRLGKFAADTRNPAIANAMEILGETENRYSGIPTIINAMEEHGLPTPSVKRKNCVRSYYGRDNGFLPNSEKPFRVGNIVQGQNDNSVFNGEICETYGRKQSACFDDSRKAEKQISEILCHIK